MSQNKPSNEKVGLLNTLSTYRTLIDDYPILITTNSLINTDSTTTIDFTMDLLKVFGVTEKDIIDILTDWIGGGVIEFLENQLKLILKTHLFTMASCGQSPIIPDYLLTQYKDEDNNFHDGAGIDININQIDWGGKLNINPKDVDYGEFYYFDVENYGQSELYKSTDFDAYLWYIINKGLTYPEDEQRKNTWNTRTPILYTEFNENKGLFSNTLTFKINYETYGDYTTIKPLNIQINKTIYDFNNDFINSVKFFNLKTMTSQIINDILGLLTKVNVKLSSEDIILQQRIDSIIANIIEQDDTEINDCFFDFTNDEYDEMVRNASLKHAGIFEYDTDNPNGVIMDYDEILKNIGEITNNSTLQEQITSIENTFVDMESTIINVTSGDNNNVYSNIIDRTIAAFTKSVVSSILSPKVMAIYMINLKVNGGEIPTTFNGFMIALLNPITQMTKQIKNIIIEELYKFLLKQIEPTIIQFNQKLAFETAIEYKDLLTNLIELGLKFGRNTNTTLDSVNYADILNSDIETPPESTC